MLMVNLYLEKGYNAKWQQVDGVVMKSVFAGPGDRVWGLNRNDDVFYREGINGTWRQINGKLSLISVARDGRVWAVNSNEDVYTRDNVDEMGNWLKIEGGKFKFIYAGAGDGGVYAITSKDDIFYREGVEGTSRQIEGKLKQLSVLPDGKTTE
jgi:hypothetical protein